MFHYTFNLSTHSEKSSGLQVVARCLNYYIYIFVQTRPWWDDECLLDKQFELCPAAPFPGNSHKTSMYCREWLAQPPHDFSYPV